jgi:hypothetical protein
MSIIEQILFLLAAIVYLGAWWRALRILFGDRFVPVEWIPIAVCALSVPTGLAELLRSSSFRGSEMWLIVPWASLPVPVLVGSFIRNVCRRKTTKEQPVESGLANDHRAV